MIELPSSSRIILVSISIWVIYSDYRVNVEKEDGGIDG